MYCCYNMHSSDQVDIMCVLLVVYLIKKKTKHFDCFGIETISKTHTPLKRHMSGI